MAAPLGYMSLFEIDTNPAGVASYVRLGDGLTSAAVALNQVVDKKSYLDDDGGTNTEVTGFDYGIAFSGDHIPTDAAQAFIFGKQLALGADCHTNFRQTVASGAVYTGDCTITIDTPPGGDASATLAVGFTINMNGKPVETLPVAATTEAGAYAEGSAIGTTKFTPTTPAGAGNHLAYRLTTAAVTSKNREYISNAITYTSGADIVAAATQYLSVWELDAYNHVVYFVCSILTGKVKVS